MSYSLYDTLYRDSNNNRIVFSDDVRLIKFYDASEESWDRNGGGTASWFLEPTLPNDPFYTSVDASRWEVNAVVSGQYSVDVDDGITFSFLNASGKLYLDSSQLWSLSGDFSICLGISDSTFVDEYRSATSFGLNIAVSSEYNVRVAKVINYGATTSSYQALYTEGANPTFFGWSALSANIDVSNPYSLIISRSGNTISCYVGTTKLAEVSGDVWLGDVSVSIGVESKQSNTFSSSASFFSVSGQLTTSTLFTSEYRGPTQEFPARSLLLVDSLGMSIVDQSNMSLWARFRTGVDKVFVDTDCGVFPINGKIYLATSTGLRFIDFTEDAVFKYSGGSLLKSDSVLSTRNSNISFSFSQSVPALISDDVEHVYARIINTHEFLSVATVSGVSLVVDQTSVINNNEGFYPSKTSYISESGKLYWAGYDYNNSGDLSYYSNVEHFITHSGTTFTRSGYYDKTTVPYSLSSSMIYDMDSVEYLGKDQIALASEDGVAVFLDPPIDGAYCKTYGVFVRSNPLCDPGFSNNLGTSPWLSYSDSWIFSCSTSIVSSWATGDSRSLEFVTGNGGVVDISVGAFSGVTQQVDFTGVDKIYYDIKVIGVLVEDDGWFSGAFKLRLKIGSTVVAEHSAVGLLEEEVSMSESVDVSSFSGTQDFYVGLERIVAGIVPYVPKEYFLLSNFRTFDSPADFDSLGGSERAVTNVFLEFGAVNKKVHYVKADGYGAVDIVHDTSDFFTGVEAIGETAIINTGGFYRDNS